MDGGTGGAVYEVERVAVNVDKCRKFYFFYLFFVGYFVPFTRRAEKSLEDNNK